MVFRSRRIKNKYKKLNQRNRIIQKKELINSTKFNWYDFIDSRNLKGYSTIRFPLNIAFFQNRFLEQDFLFSVMPFSNFCLDKNQLSYIIHKYFDLFMTKSSNFNFLSKFVENAFTYFMFIFIVFKKYKKPENCYIIHIDNNFDLIVFIIPENELFDYLDFIFDLGLYSGFVLSNTFIKSVFYLFDILSFFYNFYIKFFPLNLDIIDSNVDEVDSLLDVNTTVIDKRILSHLYYSDVAKKIRLYRDKSYSFSSKKYKVNIFLPFLNDDDYIIILRRIKSVTTNLFFFFNKLKKNADV